MPASRPAFVHDLRLFLWIKILADFTYNAQNFALPRLQQQSVFIHKIEQILLRFGGKTVCFGDGFLFLALWQRAPQHINLTFADTLPGFFVALSLPATRSFADVYIERHRNSSARGRSRAVFYFIYPVALPQRAM